MVVLLFDIDGTLIQSGGAGACAMQAALETMISSRNLPPVEFHGRTDRKIFGDVFDQLNLDWCQQGAEFCELYWEYLPASLRACEGVVLPGVREILDYVSNRAEFSVGLLTGNAQRAAAIKLQHFQLDHYFQFGGYGDLHQCRNEVAHQALAAAQAHLGFLPSEQQVWVIGDTVHDITCARAIGARVVAVETGGSCVEGLAQAKPDALLNVLELEKLLAAIGVSPSESQSSRKFLKK